MFSTSINTNKLALKQLGNFMRALPADFTPIIEAAQRHNPWFTIEFIEKAISSLGEMLNEADLDTWLSAVKPAEQAKKVGLILAGNIPLVGFHDVISVIASGNIAMIKMSSSDDKLLPAILEKLVQFEPGIASQIQYVDRLKDFDAVIATGSNNSSRYFDYYFGKVPHIIRKNRNSVAILTGQEKASDMESLGYDIFDYFGLGCRSVSKIFVPKGYDLKHFFEPIEQFNPIINHFKYNNNYDYNKSIYLVNGIKHYDNGFLLVKEDASFSSPLAVLYFEEYENVADLEDHLNQNLNDLQCVLSQSDLRLPVSTLRFGESQHPKLWNYADHVDTLAFLSSLN